MNLWFVMPAHGREELAAVCMRQLRRTCDSLTEHGIEATAVVIADDGNLDTARGLGFGTVERNNRFLAQKFNDGIQLALDPEVNPRPANYVCPIGSDDWIDYRILLTLPSPDRVLGFRNLSFVREDGREISYAKVGYAGGCGMRVYPRELMALVGYRPADEDRKRACDTSILNNVRREWQARHPGYDLLIAHLDTDPRQIVDWKTEGVQINDYRNITGVWRGERHDDPFEVLAGVYPDEALEDMRAFYADDRLEVAA